MDADMFCGFLYGVYILTIAVIVILMQKKETTRPCMKYRKKEDSKPRMTAFRNRKSIENHKCEKGYWTTSACAGCRYQEWWI